MKINKFLFKPNLRMIEIQLCYFKLFLIQVFNILRNI